MSEEKVVAASWFDAHEKEHCKYYMITVSDADGNATIEKSTDFLARQQAAKDTDGSVKYTPPSWRDNVAYGGMTYKGQLVEDTGEAYRAFRTAMNIMSNGGPKEHDKE